MQRLNSNEADIKEFNFLFPKDFRNLNNEWQLVIETETISHIGNIDDIVHSLLFASVLQVLCC